MKRRISTAEFVRRLFGRGEPEEQTFLAMLAELKPLVRNACKIIDDARRTRGGCRPAAVGPAPPSRWTTPRSARVTVLKEAWDTC